ncbi:MAG: DUF6544 family protein [Haloarculaceae archaeon]
MSASVQDTRQQVEAAMGPVTSEPYEADTLGDLPAPIRRYLETVQEPGQPHLEGRSLTQAGEVRLGGPEGSWRPFEATGVYSVSPPAYVWDADVALPALVSARVLDGYVDGDGWLRATLLGALPVAREGPDPAMNEAELQRYLAETPRFPTALLPAAGISWEGLDDERARATIVDGGVTASVVFHVDEAGLVDRVTADRYRQDTGDRAPWIGTYRSTNAGQG